MGAGESKSSSKGGKLKIKRGKRGKSEEPQFSGAIVADEAKPTEDDKTTRVPVIETPVKTPEELWKDVTPHVHQPQTSQMKSADVVQDAIVSPPSKESSSESHFTDPLLTPIEFSAEMNECYYSHESVLSIPTTITTSTCANLMSKTTTTTTTNSGNLTKKQLEYAHQHHAASTANAVPCEYNSKSNVHELKREIVKTILDRLSISETKYIDIDAANNMGVLPDDVSSIDEEYEKQDDEVDDVIDKSNNAIIPTRISEINLQSIGPPHKYRRHMSLTSMEHQTAAASTNQNHDAPQISATTTATDVLKKLSSTSSLFGLEGKIVKPTFVPEKLDFKLYEKFEGYMLINWLTSEFKEDHYLHFITNTQEHKVISVQFCTHLLAAGVLKQIDDKDAPMYNIFKPDLMYYWTHSEAPQPVPDTPGKLSQVSWPPCSPLELEMLITNDGVVANHNHNDASSPKTPELERPKRLKLAAKEVDILNLEEENKRLHQEIEKYKTLIEIQTLTEKTVKDFSSPVEETCDKGCGAQRHNESVDSVATQYSPLEIVKETPDIEAIRVASQMSGVCLACGSRFDSSQQDGKFDAVVPDSVSIASSSLLDDSMSGGSGMTVISANTQVEVVRGMGDGSEGICFTTREAEVQQSSALTVTALAPPPPPPPPPLPPCTFSDELTAPPPPPPPMPGMSSACPPPPPPPPPMPGMSGPPPPPMPGMSGPPPPPMPGMCGPPPPPMPGMSGPPPPPMPGMGGPPPPPPPMQGGMCGMPGAPPPPPPVPGGPAPLPAPPPGGWNANRAVAPAPYMYPALRKPAINPTAPMKPLYWNRIISAIAPPPQSPVDEPDAPAQNLWSLLDDVKLKTNLNEFTDLFSRQVTAYKPSKKQVQAKTKKTKAVKLLDGKRSQNVGILAQSLHVEFQEIENAIYNLDTSVVSLEALQHIYEARATAEELELIKDHLATKPEIPLDKPEQFLHGLSEVSSFADRISCFMFNAEFDDRITTIEHMLFNIKATSNFLISSSELKEVMAIILTLGNYMNGGNMTRGQADGFGLEILSKLKDVKSNDTQITLLHYTVHVYIKQLEGPFQTNVPLPIPEPGDINRAATVNFDDVENDLKKLRRELTACENRMRKVIDTSSPDNLQPFKDKMTEFIENATKRLQCECDNLDESKGLFIRTMKFYQFRPKSGSIEQFPPNDFFQLWRQFCIDFKDIWKKEFARLEQEKIRELKVKQYLRAKEPVKRIPMRENGLKAKVERTQKRLKGQS